MNDKEAIAHMRQRRKEKFEVSVHAEHAQWRTFSDEVTLRITTNGFQYYSWNLLPEELDQVVKAINQHKERTAK